MQCFDIGHAAIGYLFPSLRCFCPFPAAANNIWAEKVGMVAMLTFMGFNAIHLHLTAEYRNIRP
jgi:hypothetical protein